MFKLVLALVLTAWIFIKIRPLRRLAVRYCFLLAAALVVVLFSALALLGGVTVMLVWLIAVLALLMTVSLICGFFAKKNRKEP